MVYKVLSNMNILAYISSIKETLTVISSQHQSGPEHKYDDGVYFLGEIAVMENIKSWPAASK